MPRKPRGRSGRGRKERDNRPPSGVLGLCFYGGTVAYALVSLPPRGQPENYSAYATRASGVRRVDRRHMKRALEDIQDLLNDRDLRSAFGDTLLRRVCCSKPADISGGLVTGALHAHFAARKVSLTIARPEEIWGYETFCRTAATCMDAAAAYHELLARRHPDRLRDFEALEPFERSLLAQAALQAMYQLRVVSGPRRAFRNAWSPDFVDSARRWFVTPRERHAAAYASWQRSLRAPSRPRSRSPSPSPSCSSSYSTSPSPSPEPRKRSKNSFSRSPSPSGSYDATPSPSARPRKRPLECSVESPAKRVCRPRSPSPSPEPGQCSPSPVIVFCPPSPDVRVDLT